MTPDHVKDLKARVQEMREKRVLYDAQLRDIYDYILPFRDSTFDQAGGASGGQKTEGAKRLDKVFDSTAPKAAFRFAGRMQQDLTPLFQPFFSLEAGPLIQGEDAKKQLTEKLQGLSSVVQGLLAGSSFHQRIHELYLDLYAGTGCMLIMPGDDVDLVRFRTVPITEVSLDEGPFGDIWHVEWRRKFRYSDFPGMWPKAKFSDELAKRIKDSPRDKGEVSQYTYYDPADKQWCLVVWCHADRDDAILHKQHFRVCPWITPRFFVVPGEAYGRGPAHLALPGVKTLNKARELALYAAAFAVMGIFTRRNDGVFNPETARFAPNSFWTVAYNGGPLGPTIQRLDIPKDFDISSVVMQEERDQVRQALFDDALPPDAGAVRSATEIAERIKRYSTDFGGVSGRLTLELIKPLVQRIIDILDEKGLMPVKLSIDDLQTKVRIIAPIAVGQQADKIQAAIETIQMASMAAGPQAALLAYKVEDLLPQIGRWRGVDEEYIRGPGERQELQKMVAGMIAQQQQAEAAPAAPPTPGEMAQAYVNGVA